jgi:hypothetical protein
MVDRALLVSKFLRKGKESIGYFDPALDLARSVGLVRSPTALPRTGGQKISVTFVSAVIRHFFLSVFRCCCSEPAGIARTLRQFSCCPSPPSIGARNHARLT